MPEVKRLSTGIPEVDKLIAGGIPEGFLVAVTGEPGTGKTIFCLHFIAQGIRECDKCVYVTTEESRESIIRQAAQFGFEFEEAMDKGKLIIIDALTGLEDRWSLRSLDVEALVDKVIEAKKELGHGRGRLVIDSMSAFWLDKPAMARKYSYFVKKVLSRWGFTTLAVSQYAITTSVAWDEPVAIKDASGRVRVLPIGEFVDKFFLEGEEGSIDVSGLGLETLALDLGSLKVVWKPIARVVRRRARGPLYEVRLEAGRSVKISPDHSIYVLEGLRPTPKAGRDLKLGDFVLAPARLPELITSNAKGLVRLRSLLSSDLAFLRVRSVRQVPYDKPYVYDLSVEGAENFVAGLGGVICHNSEAFGFGIEHIADGIIRFRRFVRGGVLRRFMLVEKMRQTPHSLTMHEVIIIDGRGMVVRPARITKEDVALPPVVMEKIARASREREAEL